LENRLVIPTYELCGRSFDGRNWSMLPKSLHRWISYHPLIVASGK
jgi:hypothetical protein